jgi:hypothetical protein
LRSSANSYVAKRHSSASALEKLLFHLQSSSQRPAFFSGRFAKGQSLISEGRARRRFLAQVCNRQ